ncbi:IS5 family transposase [Methylorubrum rhodesianum]|uniref:IS5 family transposase n=1 Tax=Methylorubrum rhodesianum TaxID=29427 RepID=UPI003D023221
MARFDLTDAEWAVIEPLLPTDVRGKERVDDRRVLNGIFWRLRTGAPWADTPARYGPHTTCGNRFRRWRKRGIWDRLLDAVSKAYEGDLQMIDATSVRVHQHAACAQKKNGRSGGMGRSRGGLTSKIHALVDAEGRPVVLKITEGQAHDGRAAADMLGGSGHGQILLGDRAYDSDALRARMAEQGAWANVKPMPNRKQVLAFSPFLYKYRNLVERFFSKIKHFRAVATRYDKDPDNFLASVKLAALRVWLRAL